jgi:hypothetical protein
MRGGEEVGGVGLRLGFLVVYKQLSSAIFVRLSFPFVVFYVGSIEPLRLLLVVQGWWASR